MFETSGYNRRRINGLQELSSLLVIPIATPLAPERLKLTIDVKKENTTHKEHRNSILDLWHDQIPLPTGLPGSDMPPPKNSGGESEL